MSEQRIATASPSQVTQEPHVEECRWGWCRLTFTTHPDLIDHVMNEHVLVAKPIRLSQLFAVVRAEDGVGESLNISQFLNTSSNDSRSAWSTQTDSSQSHEYERKISDTQNTSLPSPPYSHSSPAAEPEFTRNDAAEMMPTTPSGMAAYLSLPDDNEHTFMEDIPQTSHHDIPTFASLSSQSPPMQAVILPPSPSFQSMVARSRGPIESQSSQDSTSSQSSVARALTQDLRTDSDEDAHIQQRMPGGLSPSSTTMQRPVRERSGEDAQRDSQLSPKKHTSFYDELPHHAVSTSPQLAGMKHAAVTATRRQPQAWYQPSPKRKKSTTSAKSGHSSPVTSSAPHSPVISSFQAALPNGSPLKQPTSPADSQIGSSLPDTQFNWPQVDTQMIGVLQTQAPYQSQAFSQ